MLIIADIHLGKAAAFRAQGVSVPHGTTAQNLQALTYLLAQHEVATVLFLGDFLHAKTARAAPTMAAIAAWRAQHPAVQLILVRGNHDLHAGDPPSHWGIGVVDEPHRHGPFTFCHHPAELPGTYVMAGHVHPVFRLSKRGDSLRLPCFLLGPQRMILPSFGAFTGGFAIAPEVGDKVFVATDDAVFAVAPLRSTP
ncbi:DNA ligase-associated metallophosphoesterase [Actimicrobium sp. GrIS 1.19]|nr:DNA ligase-associated metallophosphoesterase [Actimicrobium sp. GrIS 1.19]